MLRAILKKFWNAAQLAAPQAGPDSLERFGVLTFKGSAIAIQSIVNGAPSGTQFRGGLALFFGAAGGIFGFPIAGGQRSGRRRGNRHRARGAGAGTLSTTAGLGAGGGGGATTTGAGRRGNGGVSPPPLRYRCRACRNGNRCGLCWAAELRHWCLAAHVRVAAAGRSHRRRRALCSPSPARARGSVQGLGAAGVAATTGAA